MEILYKEERSKCFKKNFNSLIILGVQISSVRSKMHLFQNKMNEQIN